MPPTVIKWNKEYYEDLGEIAEDGLCDYAYRYFVYSFYLHNNAKMMARIYAESPIEYALYITPNNSEYADNKLVETPDFIVAVINFMRVAQGIIQFNYLSSGEGYKSIDLDSIKDNLREFSFAETNKIK
ncbi:MAG: hypothetical protein EOO57_06125 [Hymenobacter sp.]|nr:MAG: hypothetical protein EOO57_06125 [Hymenobacter sp.]